MEDQSWRVRSVSTDVVQTVADAKDCDPEGLEPLYGTVDPDALDALFAGGEGSSTHVRVVFTYEGYQVTVSGDGEVEVANPEESDVGSAATV